MFFEPLVSIIIPVFNGSNYLKEAIDSALEQTYNNVEILVVNDGSEDGGATERIARSFTNIKYLSKTNEGVASALNLAISEMKGEYFSWLSHDDKYLPNKIKVQVDFLRTIKNKEVILYSDFEIIDENSKWIRNYLIPHYGPDLFRPAFIRGGIINGCTLLVPKVCFDKCGVFNRMLVTTQDYDLWFRISRFYKFIHLPERLICSRQHDNQDTKRKNDIVKAENNKLYIAFLKGVSQNEISLFSKGDVFGYYLDFAEIMSRAWLLKAKKYALRRAIFHIHNSRAQSMGSKIQRLSNFYKGRKARIVFRLLSIFWSIKRVDS